MLHFLRKLFGTRQERALSELKKEVALIEAHHQRLQSLSNDALRQETEKIRQALSRQLSPQEEKIQQLKEEAQQTKELKKQTDLFAQVDQLEKKLSQERNKVLDEYLPLAFAIVKETAHRFSTKEELVAAANAFDKALAEKHPHITLKGDQVHYSSTWEVAGHAQKWSMVHYNVQLIGGIVLHQGRIAEMGTGEGKTLVATLPAFLNALAGQGVHIVTVNDYLAQRDAQWMAPLYQFHGLTVDCIERHDSYSEERKSAYQADITYGTNSEFGFDYLRDNIAKSDQEQVQRGHEYAIVDEIDQVLLDDAKTPLIISGPVKKDNNQEYKKLNPRVQWLYNEQKKLVRQFLQDAKTKIAADDKETKKEGGLSLFRAYRGLPKDSALISYLSEKGVKQVLSDTEDYYIQENKKLMPEADEPLLFTIDDHLNTISLTDKGIEQLTAQENDPDFFVLPNIATRIADIENDENLIVEEKISEKTKANEEFSIKSSRLHAVNQLLKAYALYEKNIDYVVMNGKVKLVDQKTGRILEGRRFSGGLHKGLEAKERVEVEKSTETYASITSQNQFRMYKKLSGMTGTAATESAEFWDIYRLEVIVIPPNKPIRREDLNDRIYKTQHEKYDAIAAQVEEIKKTGRPILLITPSVEVSEQLRKKLKVSARQVLNAKNHHLEADIIAQAGQLESLTIATQMAGRGTDIKLSPEALAAGGLYLIIVEKHETRRVNNQSRGRAGRQGDPGTTVCYLSLEDPLIVHFKHGYMGKQVDSIFEEEGEVIEHDQITRAIETVQKNREQNHYINRKRSLDYDDVLGKQRTIIYRKRNHALHGERLTLDVMNMLYSAAEDILERTAHNTKALEMELMEVANVSYKAKSPTLQVSPKLVREIYEKILARKQEMEKTYLKKIDLKELQKKKEKIERLLLPVICGEKAYQVEVRIPEHEALIERAILASIEQSIVLNVIDQYWQEHLQAMGEMKEAARNAAYENRDPLLVYKFEAINYFKHLLRKINTTCTQQMTQITIPEKISFIKAGEGDDLSSLYHHYQANAMREGQKSSMTNRVPIQAEKTIGRNARVTVQYLDGTIKKDVKYKTVQQDIEEKKCAIIEM